jgi:hypothetical protein
MPKTIFEPFRIHSVEPLRITTEGRLRDRGPGALAMGSLGLQNDGYDLENSSL